MEKSRISEILRGMKFSESIINASLEATKEFPGLQQALDWIFQFGELDSAWAVTPIPYSSPNAPPKSSEASLAEALAAIDEATLLTEGSLASSSQSASEQAKGSNTEIESHGPAIVERELTSEEARQKALELQARVRRQQEEREKKEALEKEIARRKQGKEALQDHDEIQQIRLRLAREEKARAAREQAKRAKIQAEKERRIKEAEARRARAAASGAASSPS